MNREELIELAKKIMTAEGTEKQYRENIIIFKKNVLDPNATDYFFDLSYTDLTPEQIVDKALSYKPIQL
ncbi:MAG: colicin immunity protein [Microscillaceae bacterium]|nr:colicin immunity protein [Microscillaceae bacterium]